MDQNNQDPSANQPQQDAGQSIQPPVDQPQQPDNFDPAAQNGEPQPPAPTPDAEAQSAAQQQPADQLEENQPQANATPKAADYIEDVGGSVVDLLDDIEESDELVDVVAKEMKLDSQKVKTILGGLLDKIDQGQITIEELALIMAAPVVDEVQDEQQ